MLATNPLLQNFAITASQAAIRPVGNFISPICEVPDLTFHYKTYTEQNRYKVPITIRQPGSPATVLGFTAADTTLTLTPNALDFPIPNADQLSDEGLQYSVMEAQSVLADAAALSLEQLIVSTANTAALASPLTAAVDFTNNAVDPVPILDALILNVMKAAKNGAPIKMLWGMTKFKQFRNNALVRGRIIVSNKPSGGSNLGLQSLGIDNTGALFINNAECMLSQMVVDTALEGLPANIQFLLDTSVIVFASNSTPNRMDPSFMKTFSRMGGFFRAGSYTTPDQRDQVLKMDWTTLPRVTNSVAVGAVTT